MNPDLRYAHLFDTHNINKEVKQKSVKAGLANLISQGSSLAITLVRAAILARLLSPEDYGVYTMVVVVISFAVIFKDLGLSTATIREKEITHAQVSNLFWINTLLGLFSMIVVIALSPGIVWFYDDSRLAPVALVLSVAFLFGGLTVQHQALLRRQMQFGRIAVISIFANISSSVLGILIAWFLHNYWALIWMELSRNLFLMIGFWCCIKWRPGLPSRHAGTKKFLKIGLDVAGLNAFSTITRDLDKIIAGRIAQASLLGLYSKGNQLPNLISGQFRMAFFSVALPALSSLQNERVRFSQYYYDFLNMISWVTMPLSVFFFIFADEIIHIYFGPKWVGAVFFMKIFAIHSFLMPAITTLDQIPLVLGESRRYLAAGIIRSVGVIFCVTAGAVFHGVAGIAIGVAFANLFTFIPFSMICIKNSPISIKDYFRTLSTPLATSMFVGGIFYWYKLFSYNDEIFNSILHMAVYLVVIFTFLVCFDIFRIGRPVGIKEFLLQRRLGKNQI
jgi:O-antigen/teichoic acid export membrane protein